MPKADDRSNAEIDDLNARLTEGLEACRSILTDYRVMITGGHKGEQFRRGASEDKAGKRP